MAGKHETTSAEAHARFVRSLTRYQRLTELAAPEDLLWKEKKLAWSHWATVTLGDEGTPSYPEELEGAAAELGLTGRPSGEHASELVRLGSSPSRLLPTDANARVQLDAGREVTDYAGLFQRTGLFLSGSITSGHLLLAPPTVTLIGEVELATSRLATFDPVDAVWADRTVQELDRAVPVGTARVYLAYGLDSPAAVLVLFGSKPVVGWAPARVDAHANPMFVPPMLPMSAVRYGIGIGELDLLRSEGASAAMTTLRRALDGTKKAIVGGLVGVRGEGPVSSDWGLDEDGHVAAYAVDFGRFRLHAGAGNVPSMPALQLTCPSLAERIRPGQPGLSEPERQSFARALGAHLVVVHEASRTDLLVRDLEKVPGYVDLTGPWHASRPSNDEADADEP